MSDDFISVEEFATLVVRRAFLSKCIRIGGYTACGMTQVSKAIRTKIGNSVCIGAEAWILPLTIRQSMNLSGAHPASYHLPQAVTALKKLMKGQPIETKEYSHEIGDHTGSVFISGTHDARFVLDGTIFTLGVFDFLGPPSILLKPINETEWRKRAIEYGMKTRRLTFEEATIHLQRKERDMQLILSNSPCATTVFCVHHDDAIAYKRAGL